MSAGWTLVLMAVCVTAGWFLGAHYAELHELERRRRVRHIHEAAVRDDRLVGAPAPPAWAPQPIGPNPGQRTEVER
jgi:hypothetical protein